MNFEEICRDYFPRWHNAKHWKLQEGSRGQWVNTQEEIRDTTEAGYCDSAHRLIWVSDSSKVTLIHEICHAVTGPSHGKRFRTRLRQATQHAERLGEIALALTLSQEADRYERIGNSNGLVACHPGRTPPSTSCRRPHPGHSSARVPSALRQPRQRAPAPGAARPGQEARDGGREGLRGVRQGVDAGRAVFERLGGITNGMAHAVRGVRHSSTARTSPTRPRLTL